jgi:phosphate transport system permease protein
MNNETQTSRAAASTARAKALLKKRYAAEKRFRFFCLAAVVFGLAALVLLFTDILSKGYSAFLQTQVRLAIHFDPQVIAPDGNRDEAALSQADYGALVKEALRSRFPGAEGRKARRELQELVSDGASYELRDKVLADPSLLGKTETLWLDASDVTDMYAKGRISEALPEDQRPLSNQQIAWIKALSAKDDLAKWFNTGFFSNGDSREPELAGIRGAAMGSLYTMLITILLALPLGVATAVYLEEFAPRNRWTDLIEVNINNLAAVPSIVFGLLGLAVLLNVFHLPRSTPLVGGVVLALMTLPRIIIPARAALTAVPPSIREAAYGLGATPLQAISHHVLPLAIPGILTGTIIGMAQALGETAPLLMIGMVAFIVDIPSGPLDPSAVLPVQIFLWADSSERAFVERTSAAILVLLGFLITMNAVAVWLRYKTTRRW